MRLIVPDFMLFSVPPVMARLLRHLLGSRHTLLVLCSPLGLDHIEVREESVCVAFLTDASSFGQTMSTAASSPIVLH